MEKIKRTFGFILAHPLARKHRFKSFSRFILWQVQSTLMPGKLFVKYFIGPVKFHARKGLTGITGNIYTGLHEFSDMTFLLHFLRKDDGFLDIGANAGSYTLLAAGIPNAKTMAFEPVPSTFNILSQNISLNNLSRRATILNAAVGAAKGSLTFTSDSDTTNHVVAADEHIVNTIDVPVVTIDESLAGLSPALIKIDVEGFETEVLKGMSNTLDLSSLKAIIIELNGSGDRYGYDENAIRQLLHSKEFRPYAYDPFKRALAPQDIQSGMNTIYCRDIEFVKSRLSTAEPVKIMGESI